MKLLFDMFGRKRKRGKKLTDEDLLYDDKIKEHKRQQRLKGSFHYCVIGVMVASIIAFIVIGLYTIYHWIITNNYNELQAILFVLGGAIGKSMIDYVKEKLKQ